MINSVDWHCERYIVELIWLTIWHVGMVLEVTEHDMEYSINHLYQQLRQPANRHSWQTAWYYRANSRFAPSQWEMALLCNDISHWLDANFESALYNNSDIKWLSIPQYETDAWNFFKQISSLKQGNLQMFEIYIFFNISAHRHRTI